MSRQPERWLGAYLEQVGLPALRELRDTLMDEGDEAKVRVLNGVLGGVETGLRLREHLWTCRRCAWVNQGHGTYCTGCRVLAEVPPVPPGARMGLDGSEWPQNGPTGSQRTATG